MRTLLAGLLAAAALAAPAARGTGGDDESRARIVCAGARVELRVKSEDDDRLELELRVDGRGRAGSWYIVMLHDRALVWHGRRWMKSYGSVRVRRTVADWPGEETVTARVRLGSGRLCTVRTRI